MATFMQTAFVRVEDSEQRKELCEWLEGIGYEFGYGAYDDSHPIVISYAHISQYIYSDIGPSKDVSIDCGTNIPMFKALAALRDDSDYMQWFVCKESYVESSEKTWEKGDLSLYDLTEEYNGSHWRKATPTEVVEYFKDK